MNNLELDLKIDETALDIEWLEQPDLMRKYTKKEADARQALDLAEDNLTLQEAKLDKEIRENPEEFGIAKITETVVRNTIISQPAHQEAKQAVIEARYEHNVLRGIVESVRNRKSALENLVILHGQSYFAGPSVPRDIIQERTNRDAQKKEANKKVRMKRKRNAAD
jgi:hypothetical protein